MQELQVPITPESTEHPADDPVRLSTASETFLAAVNGILDRDGELVVCRRCANSAGAGGGLYRLTSAKQWQELLRDVPAKTAYSVMRNRVLINRGDANTALEEQALKWFRKWGEVSIAVLRPGELHLACEHIEWCGVWLTSARAATAHTECEEQIRNLFQSHEGEHVGFGEKIAWWDDGYAITAYVPDPDGVVRPGAY